MSVSMHVAVWCGQLIACRLVWLMKLAAAEIDGAERWLVCVCVFMHPRLVEVKSYSGNQS